MTKWHGRQELAKCIVLSEENFPRPERGPGGLGLGRHRRPRMGRGHRGPAPGRDVWRSILDRRPDHPEFFLGFAEGALKIWKQIKDQF